MFNVGKNKSNKPESKNKKHGRQWWTEKNTIPLNYLHEKPSKQKIAISRTFIILTIIFWIMYVISVIFRQLIEGPHTYRITLEAFGYLLVVTFLTLSSLIYLITREGALQRFSKHARTARSVLENFFLNKQPTITVLIPSYDEEPQVIRKTLLSAALQEYPNLRVVLLMDDDFSKIKPEKLERFEQTQNMGREIQRILEEPLEYSKKALEDFEASVKTKYVAGEQILKIAKHYHWASRWLNNLAAEEVIEDHVDEFFAEQILKNLAKSLELVAHALNTSYNEDAQLTRDKAEQLYKRLVWIFGAEMEVFERKRYISLSQEPNKAMNINSYIGLMGGIYKPERTSEGLVLVKTYDKRAANIKIPDSDYILTLDADSILLPEYCFRLVHYLEQPENANIAVVQTPYSSFRGASTRIERLAGATTDVQHILHQGMTYFDATFWVGANAVIRKKALNDIVETEIERGYEIKRYVQDRTVIEDTESSIDLVINGWKLVNYPERLSYSATPPDFGSLVVQRRRWANGGLLIFPKLLKSKTNRELDKMSKIEFLIRLNYMTSIAWSNIGLIFLLAYPYDGRLLSPLVLLAALPYFIAMASDLKYCRYSYSDIIAIYGFNLILLPVNIAGVLKSLEQGLTTKKIPFARTPKVKDRTITDLPFIIAPILIVAFSLLTLWRNIEGQNWGNAAFAAFNAIAATWAIIAYIGIGNLFVDLFVGIINWLYVDVPVKKAAEDEELNQGINWKSILYYGDQQNTVTHETANAILLNTKGNN